MRGRIAWLRLGGLCLLLCTRVNLSGCDDGKARELECEEVAQHVADCCGSPSVMKCKDEYEHELVTSSGCATGSFRPYYYTKIVEPDFLPEAARCVRNVSCAELIDAGFCQVGDFLNALTCVDTNPCAENAKSATSCTPTRTCATPTQNGPCLSYRPAKACEALERICRSTDFAGE